MLQPAHIAHRFTRTTPQTHFSSIGAQTGMLGDQTTPKTYSLACGGSWRRAGFANGLDPANFMLKTETKPFSASSHRNRAATSCPAIAAQAAGMGHQYGCPALRLLVPNVPVPGPGRARVPTPSGLPQQGGQRQAARSPGLPLPAPALFPHGATSLQRERTRMCPICGI